MDEPTIQEFKQTEIGLIPEDWEVVRLGEILEEVDIRVKDLKDMRKDVNPEDLTVLSLTKNYGLIPQARRFKKRIATEDVTNYKVVRKMQIVYNPCYLGRSCSCFKNHGSWNCKPSLLCLGV